MKKLTKVCIDYISEVFNGREVVSIDFKKNNEREITEGF